MNHETVNPSQKDFLIERARSLAFSNIKLRQEIQNTRDALHLEAKKSLILKKFLDFMTVEIQEFCSVYEVKKKIKQTLEDLENIK
jgi:hypothetical protein